LRFVSIRPHDKEQQMTGSSAPTAIAAEYLRAFAAGDMDAVRAHLAEDVVFESPPVRLTGIDDVVAAIEQFAEAVEHLTIIAAHGDGQTALVMYDVRTGPFGILRAAERLVVRDGKIALDQLVFDTYAVRSTS
jgi:ketosteroid isomerase-like protein